MPQRRQMLLEGAEIESPSDLHRALAELLGFFDGYGENLDALWDVLEDEDLREVKGPVEILWRDARVFGEQHPDYFLNIQRLFAETPHPLSLLITS